MLLRLASIVIVVAALSAGPASSQDVIGNSKITGAGSTFAYPLIADWAKAYQRWQSGGGIYTVGGGGLDDPPAGAAIDYEPVGSYAGIMRAKEGAVDFGASDMPLLPDALAALGLAQFPIAISGIVPVVNVEGVGPGALRLTGAVLAEIYMGKIQEWNDPAIKALNPDLQLPNTKIAVVHRSDGSGTTFNWALYLSRSNSAWKSQIGADTNIAWPVGRGAKGNEGVALAVQATKNAIGYVEHSYATRLKLAHGLVQNQAGKFVSPSPASFKSAAENFDWGQAKDFYVLLVDASNEDAYAIAATTFVMMRKAGSQRRSSAALKFFAWTMGAGATNAANLGYVPLPRHWSVR
jgi:phosphate transport system substrate-binding protein